jgi:hypothetical protein
MLQTLILSRFQGKHGFFPMIKRVAIGCLAVLFAGLDVSARADVVIYVQDTTIDQGGYGLLNVYVGGTAPSAFDTYNVTLSITPIGGASGTVVFAPNGSGPDPNNAASGTQPYNYLYPAGSTSANYIFPNDSLNSTIGVNGGGPVLGEPSTYFAITDGSLSGNEYTPNATSDTPALPIPPTTLLASLLVEAVSTNVLEQYQVSVVLDSSSTYFTNTGRAVGPVSQDTSTANYSGTVAIGASSVPEPSSIISGLIGLVTMISVNAFCARTLKQVFARV